MVPGFDQPRCVAIVVGTRRLSSTRSSGPGRWVVHARDVEGLVDRCSRDGASYLVQRTEDVANEPESVLVYWQGFPEPEVIPRSSLE